MSSITERGQALAIFALSLTAVILAAALAFDTGDVLLERRDQQNAADAAAMHGARYILASDAQADAAARQIATANGFTNGTGSQAVFVNIPPVESAKWANFPGALEVKICNTRPSIFAGIAGIFDWDVCARAVAAQFEDVAGPWAFIALHPHECGALQVSGNGDVTTSGSIQVNSDCSVEDGGALRRSGNGTVNVATGGYACNVHGEIKNDGKAELLNCPQNEGATVLEDPLAGLGDPPMPALAPPPVQLSGTSLAIPDACQGSSKPATVAAPAVCKFNGQKFDGTEWRLYPGLYPGGIELHDGIFYLEPGIYWLGGGGLSMAGGGATVHSVEPGTMVDGGGVLLFNTQLSTGGAGQIGPINLGGADANVYLEPLDAGTAWDRLVIYQDRDFPMGGDDVTINGSDSNMSVRGTVYVPTGDVKVNGSSGKLTLDLVIGSTFKIDGAPGSQIEVLKQEDYVLLFSAAGLVE